MISLDAYLQSTDKETIMPDARTEEYRYSRVIQSLHQLSINQEAHASSIPTPIWKTDYIFYGPNDHTQLPAMPFSQLNPFFQRAHNYFKDGLIAKNDQVLQMVLDSGQPRLDLTFFSSTKTINESKIYIRVKKGQKTQLHLHSMCETQSLLFPMLFSDLEEDSLLEIFYWPQPKHNQGLLCPWLESITRANSQVKFYSFSKEIPRHRLTFFGYLIGEKSDISLHSSFHLAKDESADFYVRIFHENLETTSNQMINSVALDNANMNFNGQIAASPEAKQILAYQMFKGLLLGENAHITARPQLDIEYYDLACSHGVSIGGFTDEELFYLQSRGLNDREIYPLLTYGFLSEPFVELKKEGSWRSDMKKELSVQ